MYGLLCHPNDYNPEKTASEIKKCKGVKKIVLKEKVSFEEYRTTLESGQTLKVVFKSIRSQQHDVSTISIRKSALTPFDDKRYILVSFFCI